MTDKEKIELLEIELREKKSLLDTCLLILNNVNNETYDMSHLGFSNIVKKTIKRLESND